MYLYISIIVHHHSLICPSQVPVDQSEARRFGATGPEPGLARLLAEVETCSNQTHIDAGLPTVA